MRVKKMQTQKFFKIILGMSVVSFQFVHADPVSINPRPRMESMGNAGLATMGDRDSAMVNPAGLAEVESAKLEAFPLLIEVPFDLGLISSFTDYNDSRDSTDTSVKKSALENFLRDTGSSAEAIRVNIYPSFTKKHLHIGLLADFTVESRMRVGGLVSNQVMELGGSNGTAGLIVGSGYNFFKDSLQVGLTLKPIYRMAVTQYQDQTLNDIMQGQNAGAKMQDQIFGTDKLSRKAFGIGVDLGAKYYLPVLTALKPSVGITYQDIGDTRFIGDDTPDNIEQSLSVGAAIHPNWGIFRNTFALDYRNITQEKEFLNKLHFGAEAVIWNLLAIRAGLSQGYVTGGVGILTRILELDLYVTAKEAGRYAHIQSIRTLGLKLAIGF
jgi:hypothetical protein